MRPKLLSSLIVGWSFFVFSGAPFSAKDLSPAAWPPGEIQKYAELTYEYDRPHPKGFGRQGLIVGTSTALAVRSGLEALKQGGSAADAALVTAMAQVVLSAGCYISFAGDFALTYYDAATGEVSYLDASLATVRGETDPLSIPPSGTPSGRSALVPGFMAGVEAAHARFGKLPWASLLEPSIYFAEEGFAIDPPLGLAIDYRQDVLTRLPETRRIFTSPDGDLYNTGEILRQPQLARTLRRFARLGAGEMYTGKWARKFVRVVRREGGKMRRSDLRRYRPAWGEVLHVPYRDYEVHLPGPPADGGRFVEWMLGRFQRYDLARLGHYTRSPESLYVLMKTFRDFWLGEHFDSTSVSQRIDGRTDSVVAVDDDGNVAAAQYSIYSFLWGGTGIFIDGVSIGDTAATHSRQIANLGPGDLLPNPGNALIATKNGRPALAVASIGSGAIEVAPQALVDLIDFGRSVQRAQRMPTVRRPDFTLPGYPSRVTQGAFPESLLDAVRAMGIPIVEEPPDAPGAEGYWSGLTIGPGGKLLGATSTLFNGWAEGY